jgi:hypothetical protein
MVASAASVAKNWSNHQDYDLVVSVPMLLWDSGSNSNGANGAYDTYFKQIAQNLKNNGRGDAIIRLGWEFDGSWFRWDAFANPSAYKSYYQRIVRTMRAVSGSFKFDWTSNINGGKSVDSLYPGDSYVDIIGLDVYDQSYGQSQKSPADRWNQMLTGTNGLQWQRDFAKAHGKYMSYPEWALSDTHIAGATRDNALFVQNMYNWIKSNNVLYESYFEYNYDKGNHQLRPTTIFPTASSKYRSDFRQGFGGGSVPSSGSSQPQSTDTASSGGSATIGLIDSGSGSDHGFHGGIVSNRSLSINGTSDDATFSTARVASSDDSGFSYNISVPKAGKYTVELSFAEVWFTGAQGFGPSGPGHRVFDVRMEGKTVIDDLDINAQVGARTALTRTVTVTVDDGNLDIDFPPASKNRPIVSAIEVKAA